MYAHPIVQSLLAHPIPVAHDHGANEWISWLPYVALMAATTIFALWKLNFQARAAQTLPNHTKGRI